ncbi:hypothetical protein [Sphingomonas sp. LT1P40]|uniref:hypothetical protein n=1 Tax=Alteristakelama amylovorans TaxID=3096166 RepID=UPI002FC7796E
MQMTQGCLAYQNDLKLVAEKAGTDISEKLKVLSDRYSEAAIGLRDEAENQAYFEFEVTWDETKIVFDLPEVEIVDQDWVLDLPQVTMVNQEMIFHTPSVRMTLQKVGQYPEFHGFTVVWKDILIEVPEFFMQEQRIVMGVPEFRVDRTEMTLGIPEFTMARQEIIMGLPQFKLIEAHVNIQIEAQKLTENAQRETAGVKAEAVALAAADFAQAATALFSCLRTSLQNKRLETAALMEPAITMLESSISKFSSIDSDESRQMISDLSAKLDLARVKKAEADAKFDVQISTLLHQERATVEEFVSKLGGA